MQLRVAKLAMLILQAATLFAANEQVLWMFNPKSGTPGFPYYNSLIRDVKGNLYGATSEGGTNNTGAVFELSPHAGGGWDKQLLYSFPNLKNNELIGGVVLDSAGNIYGVSAEGGLRNTGYVYELLPQPGGGWTATVLHNFGPCCQAGADGAFPFAGLAIDGQGNLFGTTSSGGTANFGTVYELTRNRRGNWSEAVIHNFADYSAEGGYPESNLLIGADGSLYGTASQGGLFVGTCTVGCGTVFKLTPNQSSWTYSVLHFFQSADGQYSRYAGVTMDPAGNLFGATEGGGANQAGTIWKLTLSPDTSTYSIQTLHSFGSSSSDGAGPLAGVVLDKQGSVFGATPQAGRYGFGNVFKLSKTAGNSWEESILYDFMNDNDGGYPSGGVVIAPASGNVFGLTSGGGAFGNGVVYEIKQ